MIARLTALLYLQGDGSSLKPPPGGRNKDVCHFLRKGHSFDLSAFDPGFDHLDEIVAPAAE
jgi:hypothetical protein